MEQTKYKSLEFTDKEIEALNAYTGYRHNSINCLLTNDITKEITLSGKGWNISYSEENFKFDLDTIKKMYSTMYKNLKQNGPVNNIKYRGTSDNETINYRNNQNNTGFISTTDDKNVAMSFSEYQNGAIVSIKSDDDIPYINVNEILGDKEDFVHSRESETIFSPFTQIKRTEKISGFEGINYYNVSLKKQELQKEDMLNNKDEISDLEVDIEENISEMSNILMKYKNAADNYEKFDIINKRLLNDKNIGMREKSEDLEVITKSKEEALNIIQEEKVKYSNLKEKIIKYTMNVCKEIELEIDKNFDKEKFEEKEQLKLESARDLNSVINNTMSKKTDLKNNFTTLDTTLEKKAKLQNKYENIAKDFNVKLENTIAVSETSEEILDIKSNVEELFEKLENLKNESIEGLNKKEIDNLNCKVSTINENISIISKDISMINKYVLEEDKNDLNNLKKAIYLKVDKLIDQEKIKKLDEEKTSLNSKNSILDKITGKSKIKEAKIENINIKKQILNSKGQDVNKPNYSLHEAVANIDIFLNDNTNELNENNILSEYRNKITNSFKINELSVVNNIDLKDNKNTNLPIQETKKIGLFSRNKQILEKLTLENERLKQEISYNNNTKDEFINNISNLNNNESNNVIKMYFKEIKNHLPNMKPKFYSKEDMEKTAEMGLY